MEIEIKINFHFQDEVKIEHRAQLENQSRERIFQMLNDDYTGGELIEDVDGTTYYGWWSINTEILA